jgi:two-component system response regulator AtoC
VNSDAVEDPKTTKEAPRIVARDPRFVLILQHGREVTTRPLPDSGSIDLGRDASCSIAIEDDSVSRRHCRIDCGSRLWVQDLGSRNGTRVLGRTLAKNERVELFAGNVLELGSVVAFVQRGPIDDLPTPRNEERSGAGTGAGPERVTRPSILRDSRMHELYALLDVIAPSPFCVLILGETGVGKDVFAEALHHRSSRAKKPLLRLNCAALAESILEGELFGYEKGAFTGAVSAKEGLFEAADGGTVFLDEVGDMPLTTQARLLRVLENGEVMRLGSTRTKRVDVRFVSATHRDLQGLCANQQFRPDLYFRLSGVVVTIPPLRERHDDIASLAEHFVSEAGRRLGRSEVRIAPGALDRLHAYPWPGNIRELRNVLERAVLLAKGGLLEPVHLDAMASAAGEQAGPQEAVAVATRLASTPAPAGESGTFRETVRELERERILEALEKCAGNQSRAAKMLGIPRRTFVKRLDVYGIARPRKGQDGDDDA